MGAKDCIGVQSGLEEDELFTTSAFTAKGRALPGSHPHILRLRLFPSCTLYLCCDWTLVRLKVPLTHRTLAA